MGCKLDLPIQEICDKYSIGGMNTYELAEEYGVSVPTIIQRLGIGGVEFRTWHEAHKNFNPARKDYIDRQIDVISEKYLNGMMPREIGEEYGCSDTTIRNKLVSNGTKMRSLSEAKSNPSTEQRRNMSNAHIGIKLGESLSTRHKERISAGNQKIPYELWNGYTNKTRPHLTPICACTHLNPSFDGFESHHITSGVIVNLPYDLHRGRNGIQHRFPTENREGKNMKEINKLALKYLLSGGV